MSTKYDWVICSLDCYPDKDGYENVVFNINWRRNATDGINLVDLYGSQPIDSDVDSSFVPYVDLTKTKIVSWLEAAMGKDVIKELDANLNNQLTEISNPSTIRPGLPWE